MWDYLHLCLREERNRTKDEMKTWLKEQGISSPVTDPCLVAGWEDSSTVIAITARFGQAHIENICLRAVSSVHVIKAKKMTRKPL